MKKKNVVRVGIVLGGAILLLFILLGGSSVNAAEYESALNRIQRTQIIRFGWALWFPWNSVDQKTNKVVGIGPDVVEEMAKALGNVKIEFVADSWGTLAGGLQAGKFDLIYPFGSTLKRALAVDFTDDTMRESQNFLIRKKDSAKFKTVEDVNRPGVKVGASLGTNTEYELTRLYKNPEIIRYKSIAEGFMSLSLGKIDVVANTGSGCADAVRQYPDLMVIKGHFALAKNCMAVRQGDQIFLNWLNLFIADMKETKTLDRIFQKYGIKREVFF